MRIRTLGDVHELPLSRFYGQPDGGETIAELAVTIARLRARKIVPTERPPSGPPRGLFQALDVALGQLEPNRRESLLLRFGADGGTPLSNREIAGRLGLGSRQNVEQVRRTALKHLRHAAGPELTEALRALEENAGDGNGSLGGLLKRRTHRKRDHALDFYVRIVCELSPALRGHVTTRPPSSGIAKREARQAEAASERARESVPPRRAAVSAKTKSNRGFASMDPAIQRELSRMGGKVAHQQGTAHEFTHDEARAAGAKGGRALARNREHMATIGRLGGLARGQLAAAPRAARKGS